MTTFQAAEPNFKEIQEAIRTLRNNKHQASTVAAVILETLSFFFILFYMEVCEKDKRTEENRHISNFKKDDKM